MIQIPAGVPGRIPLTSLDPEQMEEIIQALEDGMSDEEIRTFYDPDLNGRPLIAWLTIHTSISSKFFHFVSPL